MRAVTRTVTTLGAAGAALLALLGAAVPALAGPSDPPAATINAPVQIPVDVAAVPGCEPGCEVVFVEQLPADVLFAGLQTRDPKTGFARGLVAYWAGGELRGVAEPDEQAYVVDAACGYQGDAQRCAVTSGVGAHSASVTTMLLTYNGGIEISDRVVSGTADAVLTDVDGSGRPDAVVRQSTYDPAYAGAPTYWETWLEFEGQFVRSGCGPLSDEPTAAPTAPLYAPCPA
jgi:hypothetical protein